MERSPVHNLYHAGDLSESKRILTANYTHFLTLSFLFLPLSFYLIVNPTLSLSGNFFTIDHFHKFPQNHQKPLASHLFYILIVFSLALCAISTITYSTHHVFSGKPIKLFATLKSLTSSFFPLVLTAFIALADLLFLISLTFLLFVGVTVMLGQNLSFVIHYNLTHFTWLSISIGATLIAIIAYFLLNWSLAFVVVVLESKWGFEALSRSSYLVNGLRLASSSLLLFFWVILGCTVFVMSDGLHALRSSSYALLPMTVGPCMLMWFLVWSTAANTVLYIYCKDFHGEMAIDTVDGSAYDYVNLPSVDEKIRHVIAA